ncbi:alkylphosphonate utilization protein [Actibacterium sp. XHP0104]|uniref:alkylphosphonate utilization protein n=1 Tax=Actibacterium sp. XHP0104 TaxID=2984335 RepID=UPI0021E87D8D|nr:alkylphosphonate utilization protein [Actibacterium sp. XHP0104]MCV2881770.1 alkylphosphonate utilization protein [Actibacterium sp. XHP0104]
MTGSNTPGSDSCVLCGASATRAVAVAPRDDQVALCDTCAGDEADDQHWRCLLSSMWSEEPAVQVLAWRKLNQLRTEPWAAEALDMLYLEPEVQDWAEAGQSDVVHRDSNGTVLAQGDTVTLIKDLPVKGAGFTAKRGTAVRGISLVPDNAAHIEGRVEGQRIVILTEFVKKR